MAPDSHYAEAIRLLRQAGSVVITMHVKPDSDALGSAAALRHWLLAQGKTVRVIVPTSPAPKYAFLDPDRVVQVAGRDVDLRQLPAPDLVCTVDTCTWGQLEGMEPLIEHSGAPVLAIDHHQTQDALADFLLVDAAAPATAVIMHRLLQQAGATIDATLATYLLAGLGGDTDWFRLATVDPAVFRLAADLVAAGAKPYEVFDHLYMSDEMAKVQLKGRAIELMEFALDDRVVVMRLPRSLFRELGADIGDTENLITECMRVRGVSVGVMLVETEGEEIRISLRSRPPVNVLQVARGFGGGGHLRAAGARLNGSMDAVIKKVLVSVARSLDETDAAGENA
jgi:bifunctional oligoribonuclease and PAP phosphatase NrnA